MNEPTFSIIIPTIGRKTLEKTLESISPQRSVGDEVIVVFDDGETWENNKVARSHGCILANTLKRSHDAGSKARNLGIDLAQRDWLLFMDDDDVFTPNAFQVIRETIVKTKLPTIHLFRMRYSDGKVLWKEPEVTYGNVGTPMIALPRLGQRVLWKEGIGAGNDYQFITDAINIRKQTPIWSEEIICQVRPQKQELI